MASRTTRTTINRRRLLALSAGGAALLAAGGLGIGLQSTVLRTPRRALLALDLRTFSVLAAVADRFCPGGEGLPTAWALEVPEDVDAFLASNHPGVAADVRQGLLLVENGLPGLLLDLDPRPFTARPPDAQDAALQGMATSRLALRRTLYKALLGMVTATYWGHPETFAASGYQPLDFTGFVPAPPSEEPPAVEEAP